MIRKTKLKYSILSATAGLSLLGSVVTAGAAEGNYLQNGDFSFDVFAWELHPGADSTYENDGGRLLVTNDSFSEAPLPTAVSQCVDVVGDQAHTFSAEVFIPSDQDRAPHARIVTFWYDDYECEGLMLSFANGGGRSTDGSLTYWPMSPEDAKSARAVLVLEQLDPIASELNPDPMFAEWDNVYFGRPMETAEEPDRPDGDGGEPVVLEEPENPQPPDVPQVEDERPDEPGDRPQDEPGDDPQDEPGDEPQDEPGDEPQDDQPLELGEPGEEVKSPLPPDTGTGTAIDSPEVLLAAGVIGAAMAVALGGTMLMPAKRKRQ